MSQHCGKQPDSPLVWFASLLTTRHDRSPRPSLKERQETLTQLTFVQGERAVSKPGLSPSQKSSCRPLWSMKSRVGSHDPGLSRRESTIALTSLAPPAFSAPPALNTLAPDAQESSTRRTGAPEGAGSQVNRSGSNFRPSVPGTAWSATSAYSPKTAETMA